MMKKKQLLNDQERNYCQRDQSLAYLRQDHMPSEGLLVIPQNIFWLNAKQ